MSRLKSSLAIAENKPPKIEIREKLVPFKVCDDCHMENHKKAKAAYESLTFCYKAFFFFIAGYALFISIFQLMEANVFIESCKNFFNALGSGIEYIKKTISCLEWSENNVINICLRIFISLLVIIVVMLIVYLIERFYVNKYIFHWGTAAEVLCTLGLFVNLDSFFPLSWQGHLFTIFLVLHIVYLITIYVVRFKIDNS